MEHKSLVTAIVESLEEQIIDGRLKPGERVGEQKLCEQLGVSRSPVREAFRILESKRFLVKQDRKGVTVARISLKEAEDAYIIRANLESLATCLAVKRAPASLVSQLRSINDELAEACAAGDEKEFYRINDRFHETLINHCGNEQLIQMLSVFAKHTARYRKEVLSIPGRLEDSVVKHEMLIKSLEDGDAEGAEKIRRESILANTVLLRQRFKEEEEDIENQS